MASQAAPSSPPSPKPSTSPPRADTVVRPFTSQGSASNLYSLSHSATDPSNRPSTAYDVVIDPPRADVDPYTSASARTSYTRVDVDSLPTVYPPLPPLPTAFAVFDGALGEAEAVDSGAIQSAGAGTTSDGSVHANANANIVAEPVIPQTPQVVLTFLLVSGRRKTQTFEPETTVGRVKELVWNAWPTRDTDWQDERPPAPSYLRILYLGKILQDEETLLRAGFPTSFSSASNAPTIVHLSIRPYVVPSDDLALGKKRRLSIAIGRRLSTGGVGVGMGVGARNGERESDEEARRAGCCTGCTIC